MFLLGRITSFAIVLRARNLFVVRVLRRHIVFFNTVWWHLLVFTVCICWSFSFTDLFHKQEPSIIWLFYRKVLDIVLNVQWLVQNKAFISLLTIHFQLCSFQSNYCISRLELMEIYLVCFVYCWELYIVFVNCSRFPVISVISGRLIVFVILIDVELLVTSLGLEVTRDSFCLVVNRK